MKLLRLLFKPKWQHKNPAVRRDAVTTLADAELIGALPRLVREDADAGVRLAALRRLDDYEAWRERSTGDADAELRRAARAAYLGLLAVNRDGLPALERRIAELDTLSADEIDRLATNAVDVRLRGAALERVRRPSLLAERATTDPDPALRQAALARIDDADTLARIGERARKTDKLISRLARERAEALRIAAGDTVLIASRARQLCERVEAQLQVARGERSVELAAIQEAWRPLADHVPTQLRERFAATLAFLEADTDAAAATRERLRSLSKRLAAVPQEADATTIETVLGDAARILADMPTDLPERAPIEDAVSRLTRRMAVLAISSKIERPVDDAEAFAAKVRFDAALANAQAETRREQERERALRHQLESDIVLLEQRLEHGDLAGAHELRAQIENSLRELPEVARHGKRLVHAFARHDELRRWQRWSNNERRKALCTEIEALPAAGLHPDAVATRVREARVEWQQLDASEGFAQSAAGERPTQGLARRFQALCNHALKPTKSYFSKRHEVRESHREEIERVLADTAALADDSSDWPAWARQRRAVAATLHALDRVEPRERKVLAQRLKDALARIDASLEVNAQKVDAAKRRLIAAAERAAQNVDPLAAASEIKELQARWKNAGHGRRKNDEAQWQQFRAIGDAVFGKIDAGRREREQQDAAARATAQVIANDFAALLDTSGEMSRVRRRELEQRWAALDLRDRTLERRWRELQDRADNRLQFDGRQRRLAIFADARARLALCVDLENGLDRDFAAERWQTLPEVEGQLGAALRRRFDTAQTPHLADDETLRGLLVQLEYLGAIDSPEEDRQRRMDAQVMRLSRRLGGSAGSAPRDELIALLAEWISAGRPDAAANARFARALDAAIARLP